MKNRTKLIGLIMLLLLLALPTLAQDPTPTVEILSVSPPAPISADDALPLWAWLVFFVALFGGLLAGGGLGYFAAKVQEARHRVDLMGYMERQYNQSADAIQKMVQTVENTSKLLAISIPPQLAGMSLVDLKAALTAISELTDEVSDGVPIADKPAEAS